MLSSTLLLFVISDLTKLSYQPSPVDNPLRGLVPYQGKWEDTFPHSMEFNYIPLDKLVVGEKKYNWEALESLLNDVATRGHQTIFRVYMEYPGQKGGIPQYLLNQGLKVFSYSNSNTKPSSEPENTTPDYSDPRLRQCLKDFLAALGSRYDGDPRIGFITAGLLGMWGEWHCYPKDELFAKPNVQKEVLDAYELNFRRTPILLRYPRGKTDNQYVENTSRRMGYHDDSFAWATLDTKKPEDFWFFMPALKAAGSEALNKWKTQPIGGEIRPEAWVKVFQANPGVPQIQDFEKCVQETHVSWLMESGITNDKPPKETLDRATRMVGKMGYEFHIPWIRTQAIAGTLFLTMGIQNRGVAPFYANWPSQVVLINSKGEFVKQATVKTDYRTILPGTTEERNFTLPLNQMNKGDYKLLYRIQNPMKGGYHVKFANTTQDEDLNEWLTLTTVRI